MEHGDDTGTAPGFRRATGMSYVRFLNRLHEQTLFDWYMEVGCRTGRTFAHVRGKTIAVDPYFRIDSNVMGTKSELHLFQKTSDAFFDSRVLSRLGVTLSFSFLDGMHLFEYLLRDFINTERHSAEGGVIALHDCCPFDHAMTTRDLGAIRSDAWTGDVWKLIPVLRQYRPDLTLTVLDARPTGVVLVSGLDPRNRKLQRNQDRILAEMAGVDLATYGVARFNDLFEFTDTRAFLLGGLGLFDAVRLDASQAPEPRAITP